MQEGNVHSLKERTRDQERFCGGDSECGEGKLDGIGIRVCVVVYKKREKGILVFLKTNLPLDLSLYSRKTKAMLGTTRKEATSPSIT